MTIDHTYRDLLLLSGERRALSTEHEILSMRRRDFLKALSGGMLAVAMGPFGTAAVIGCGAATRPKLNVRAEAASVRMLDPDSAAILAYASLAPSTHNTQPWRVRIQEPGHWIIGSDPARRLLEVDPLNREMLLSLGAFTENLVLAAGALGHTAVTTIIAGNPFMPEVMDVRLTRAPAVSYPFERITLRRTVRRNYRDRELAGDVVRTLLAPLGDGATFFPPISRPAAYLREAVVEAFRAQTYREQAQVELSHWIRFDDADVYRHRDGLTPASMELSSAAAWYARHFMSRDDVMTGRFRVEGIDIVAKQARHGGGWFVVTSDHWDVTSLLDAGRRFERMALLAREHGVAIHPMSQVLEEKPWQERLAVDMDVPGNPQFILRAGYVSPYPAPVSLRRPIASFVSLA